MVSLREWGLGDFLIKWDKSQIFDPNPNKGCCGLNEGFVVLVKVAFWSRLPFDDQDFLRSTQLSEAKIATFW